jgi:hypothetical protein
LLAETIVLAADQSSRQGYDSAGTAAATAETKQKGSF